MVSANSWDSQLREHGGHLLQSWTWGAFKQGHGWSPERVIVKSGGDVAMAQVVFRHKGPVSIGYVPRGPVIAGDAAEMWPRLRAAIDKVARRHRAICVIFEPDTPLPLAGTADSGVVEGPCNIQPVRTVKVALCDDESLLRRMHQKTRYNVRLAPRRGVRFQQMAPSRTNVASFHELMRDTSERNEFGIHTLDYYADFLELFGDDAALLGAWSEDGHLAASLIVARFGDEAIYLYGSSSTRYRAHGAGASIQFEAMKWSREQGCAVYDLWGLPPIDPDSTDAGDGHIAGTKGDDWRGLYRFKMGFGGEVVCYPPTFERQYVPVLPRLARRMGFIHE